MTLQPFDLARLMFGGLTDQEPWRSIAYEHHRRPGAPVGNGVLITAEIARTITAADPQESYLHVQAYTTVEGQPYHTLWSIEDWRESAERQYVMRVNAENIKREYYRRLKEQDAQLAAENQNQHRLRAMAECASRLSHGALTVKQWLVKIIEWHKQAAGDEEQFRASCDKFIELFTNSFYIAPYVEQQKETHEEVEIRSVSEEGGAVSEEEVSGVDQGIQVERPSGQEL